MHFQDRTAEKSLQNYKAQFENRDHSGERISQCQRGLDFRLGSAT